MLYSSVGSHRISNEVRQNWFGVNQLDTTNDIICWHSIITGYLPPCLCFSLIRDAFSQLWLDYFEIFVNTPCNYKNFVYWKILFPVPLVLPCCNLISFSAIFVAFFHPFLCAYWDIFWRQIFKKQVILTNPGLVNAGINMLSGTNHRLVNVGIRNLIAV